MKYNFEFIITAILFYPLDPPHSRNQLIVLYNIGYKRKNDAGLLRFCDIFNGNIF